jgi:hypothetical protein
MSFNSRGFLGSQLYPTIAGEFILATAPGGPLTTTQKRALGYLVNNLTDLGIGAVGSNWLIYPFIGTSSGNNSRNLFSASTNEYNLTFVGSPTQNSAGTTFNGTTQYAIAPSLALYPLSPNLTLSNISYGFCTTGIGAGTYIPIGYFSSANSQTKTYSTAGSFTFNPNSEAPGITAFTINVYGGGGAGGGTNGTTSNFPAGGGAGGGWATRNVTLTNAQGATSMTITVGAGGTANSGAAGGNGGDSIVTHPNFTGLNGNGGTGGKVNTAAAGAATTAPTANSGTTVNNGGTGAAGGAAAGRGGGGGGSSAGVTAGGNAGTTPTTSTGGAGGTAPTGGVAGGAGGNGTLGGAGFAGSPGTAGGGAGGGAGSTSAGNNRAGGAGGDGKVTITWSPGTFRRNTISIFNTGAQQLDCSVDTDNTSRYQLITAASLNGVRVGSRRGNSGTAADMGFYINNSAASSVAGPAVMSTTSFNPSPNWYIGAANTTAGGAGSVATSFYSGTLNFAFIGPGLSDGQLQALYTLITTYNTILGR